MYRGDIRLGNTIDIKFVTTAVATGAPTTLSGSPVISAYVGNGTTQITAGITLSVDFDSVTGLNNVRVVASSGNGFATATDVQLVITTGTVGGTSVVGYVVAEFSIENRSALMPTTAARTLDVSAGGEAGLDWANVGSPTTAVNLSATNIDVDQVVASVSGAVGSVTGAVGSVTGNVGGNVTGTVGTVNALAANVITAASMAADASAEIADAVWDEDATGHQTQGTFGQAIGDPVADTNTIYKAVVTDSAGATVGIDVVAVKAETASIQSDTNDLQTQVGTAGAGLTNINLPNQTMDIIGNITGNLSGSVGSVTGNVGGNVVGSVASVTAGVALTAGERTTLAGVVGTTAQTESYRADGATGSIAQLLYEATAHLGESSISGTTKTIKKVDGSTTAATFTLDDATTPTSITRAT